MPLNNGHAVLLSPNGEVYVCGSNKMGQLGTGSRCDEKQLLKIQCPEMNYICTTNFITIGIASDGTLWGCGTHIHSVLKIPKTNDERTDLMSQLPEIRDLTHVSAGHTFIIWSDTTNRIWFRGIIDGFSNVSFKMLSENICVEQLTTGRDHALILDISGFVYSFGRNYHGQLGNTTTDSNWIPTQIHSLSDIISISSGESHNVCLSRDGRAYSFGSNYFGELGSQESINTPGIIVLVDLDFHIVAVDCGGNFSVFYDFDGNVWMSGFNCFGQLGFADKYNRRTPEISPGLKGMKIIPGTDHIIAIDPQGDVYVCGEYWCENIEIYPDGTKSSYGLFRLKTDHNFAPPTFKIKSAMSHTDKIAVHK